MAGRTGGAVGACRTATRGTRTSRPQPRYRLLPRDAYWPFGGGPRICIGSGYALMATVLVAATLIQRVRYTLLDRDVTPVADDHTAPGSRRTGPRRRGHAAREPAMTGRWRVAVDPDRCVGSGTCWAIAPDLFEPDGGRRSRPVAELVAPDDAVLEATELCPAEAISATVVDTGAPAGRP
jgi:ferredoxin